MPEVYAPGAAEMFAAEPLQWLSIGGRAARGFASIRHPERPKAIRRPLQDSTSLRWPGAGRTATAAVCSCSDTRLARGAPARLRAFAQQGGVGRPSSVGARLDGADLRARILRRGPVHASGRRPSGPHAAGDSTVRRRCQTAEARLSHALADSQDRSHDDAAAE
ncbi:hypothetical protein GCM10010193_23460 [Kitasatospora atroaurantiaca]